jgi:hypothetical protein
VEVIGGAGGGAWSRARENGGSSWATKKSVSSGVSAGAGACAVGAAVGSAMKSSERRTVADGFFCKAQAERPAAAARRGIESMVLGLGMRERYEGGCADRKWEDGIVELRRGVGRAERGAARVRGGERGFGG